MKKNNYVKVIQLADGGATWPLPFITAYGTEKAGIVRFIESVLQECKDYNISFNSIAPGILKTNMLDEVIDAGPSLIGEDLFQKMINFKEKGNDSSQEAVNLIIKLISQEDNKINGKIISSIWDNWEMAINENNIGDDIWTVRRIIGKDRNKEILDKWKIENFVLSDVVA